MTAKIQIRRDTTANWGTDPVLNSGEFGLDTTLSQIKVGTGAVWSATPWLTGSLPYFGSPSSSDLNDGTNRIAGRYRFVSAVGSPTNGPFTFAAEDGIATLLVTAYGDTIAQFLSTEGNGTTSFPSKNYFRLYDGGAPAWRAWMPLSNWATGASVGTPIECTTINAKGIVTIADGAVGAPAIAFATDSDTGLYVSGTNQLGIAVNGVKSGYFTSTQFLPNSIACTTSGSFGTTLAVNGLTTLTGGGSLGAALAMGSYKITGLGNPTAATDAVNVQYLEGVSTNLRIGSVAVVNLQASSISYQQSGTTTSGIFNYSSGLLTSTAGTWIGVVGDGAGKFGVGTITTSTASFAGGNITSPLSTGGTAAYWLILTRIS